MARKSIIGVLFFVAVGGLNVSAQAPAQPKPAVVEEPPSVLAVPPGFRYNSRGRRDPFVNPIPKPLKSESGAPTVRPPGLRGVLLTEALISGIVWSKDPDMVRVVLAAPGGRTYFAHKGETLFDSMIKEIQRDGVVFVMQSKDPEGKTTTREVVRKVRPTP